MLPIKCCDCNMESQLLLASINTFTKSLWYFEYKNPTSVALFCFLHTNTAINRPLRVIWYIPHLYFTLPFNDFGYYSCYSSILISSVSWLPDLCHCPLRSISGQRQIRNFQSSYFSIYWKLVSSSYIFAMLSIRDIIRQIWANIIFSTPHHSVCRSRWTSLSTASCPSSR